MSVIAVSHLTKRYGRSKVTAVDDVSMAIEAGEVYGFLGANGAGKSTTIRTIMGFLRPTSGTVQLLGRAVSDRTVSLRNDIGYLSGDVILPHSVTGRKLLAYLGDLGKMTDATYRRQLASRFEAQLDVPTNELSKGNRQKIGIIQACMHHPKVLILDEPTSGLDPLMQEQFYETVKEACAGGTAVLMSSHNFDEVERVCDRVGIIRKGKLVYEGTVSQIAAAHPPSWRVTLRHGSDIAKLTASSALKTTGVSGATVIVEPAGSIEAALSVLGRFPIAAMTMYQRELEEEFMNFYTNRQESSL